MAPPAAIEVQASEDTHAPTMIEPLSINGVPARRAKGPPMARGVAPHSTSDMFKGPVCKCIKTGRILAKMHQSKATSPKPNGGIVSLLTKR